MRNLIIILLTVLIVISGFFLPGVLMKHTAPPEIDLNSQQVNITLGPSSDFSWRMAKLGENAYGDNPNLVLTYISREEADYTEEEPETDIRQPFLDELLKLAGAHILAPELVDAVKATQVCSVTEYYLYDSQAVKGFRVSQLHFAVKGWEFLAVMDVENGKLARIVSTGGNWNRRDTFAYPELSWYDILRSYADYLGLSSAALPSLHSSPYTLAEYQEKITADRLAAQFPGTTDWVEVRAMQDASTVSLCVYQGGA